MKNLVNPTEYSNSLDVLITSITISCAFLVFLVAILIGYFCFKYYHKKSTDREGAQNGNNKMEATWIIGTTIFFLIFFFWAADLFRRQVKPEKQADEIVYVFGKQWVWKFQHESGHSEANILTLPANTAVRLVMISQDVIHSFYVPDFRIKQDVIPGYYTNLYIEPAKVGEYRLFCAEFCGTDHSKMTGTIKVIPREEYRKRFGKQFLAENGRAHELVKQHACLQCHNKETTLAPALHQLFGKTVATNQGLVRVDENYLRESIFYPQRKIVAGYTANMPSFSGQLTEEEMASLIEYLKNLEEAL